MKGESSVNLNRLVPGPGAYDTTKTDMSPQGKYVISKMQNCLTRKFAISRRKPLAERSDSPGPGNYKLPSEFGYYMSRKAYERTIKTAGGEKEKEKENH